MRRKLVGIVMAFMLALIIMVAGLNMWVINLGKENTVGKQLVAINEIRQLTKDESGEKADALEGAIRDIEAGIRSSSLQSSRQVSMYFTIGVIVVGLLYTVALLVYVYMQIIRPFHKLEKYAQNVAAGDLETRLDYERNNYFGEFTWAFDHLRKEIIFARKKEAQAIESNKTIVASLSHDIKTPIASIRAYSEALEANLGADYEKRQQYAGTIIRKCDEVTALVNDLVLHSLSELEKLDIKIEKLQVDKVIRDTVRDLEFENLVLSEPVHEAVIMGDARRVAQLLENLINNARKYAPGKRVTVFTEIKGQEYQIHVKDEGKGINPEDMPFIRQKFYRGDNVGDMPGSGLGLYIVDYIVKEMKGRLDLYNSEMGLEAVISFPVISYTETFSS